MEPTERQFDTFYHGTIENIPEGTMVTPRRANDWAWATNNLSGAIDHTRTRIGTGMGRGDKSQAVTHGNIYEVEPVKGDETLSPPGESGIPGAVASRVGFKVKKQIASVLKPVREE